MEYTKEWLIDKVVFYKSYITGAKQRIEIKEINHIIGSSSKINEITCDNNSKFNSVSLFIVKSKNGVNYNLNEIYVYDTIEDDRNQRYIEVYDKLGHEYYSKGIDKRLKEEKILQKIIKIDYICDICKIGYMRPTSINNPNFPNEYQHICNNIKCNHIQNFFETNYPYIMYESKLNEDLNEKIKEDLKIRIKNFTHRMKQAIDTKQYDVASKFRNEQKELEEKLRKL